MFKRTSFQAGSLKKEKRQRGPDVWVYRWREVGPDGVTRKPKAVVGTVDKLSSKSLAKRAVEALGLGINKKAKESEEKTVQQVLLHYAAKEPSSERVSKTPYTCEVYAGYFKTWIAPRWGAYKLSEVKTAEVETWLRSIKRADGTKVKIRNLMATLFNHSIRWEFTNYNPITGPVRGSGVRQSGKRMKTPDVLTVEEISSILNELSDRTKILVFLIACTGLRFSELRGLKWRDVDFDARTLAIHRGVVKKHVGDLKSRASHRLLPLHPHLATALGDLLTVSTYIGLDDWIFASDRKNGSVPIWPTSLMEDHVRPGAVRAGVEKHVNWKTFRTSVATQMNANSENIKTTQAQLGHARSQITADVYTQAVSSQVRSAHDKIVSKLIALPTTNRTPDGLVGPLLAPGSNSYSLSS
jgi:integrase